MNPLARRLEALESAAGQGPVSNVPPHLVPMSPETRALLDDLRQPMPADTLPISEQEAQLTSEALQAFFNGIAQRGRA